MSRFVHCVFVFVFLYLSFLVSAGPLSTVYLFLRLTVPLDPPLTLSAAFPTFADSLQVLQKKVDICLAPFN